MLEALVVPIVTSTAARLVKALVAQGDSSDGVGEDVGALASALVRALFARRDETSAAIADLAARIEEVRDTQWTGPYKAAMDELEKVGRGGLDVDDRFAMLERARARLADAKGAAPPDPRIAATLDTYYALAWIAQGRVGPGKDQLVHTSADLEEAMLATHGSATKEVRAWREHQTARARDSAAAFTARYLLGSRVFAEPVDPLAPDGSFLRLNALVDEHSRLRELRQALYASGDSLPVTVAKPKRSQYDAGTASLVVEQPRHVTATCFGVTITASLAPQGPNRSVTFSVVNGRARPINGSALVTATTGQPTVAASHGTSDDQTRMRFSLRPGATASSIGGPAIVLSTHDTFVLEVEVPTDAEPSVFRVPFAPDPNVLLYSFQDRRAMEASRETLPSDQTR